MKQRLCLILTSALALAACGGETKKETGGKAGGEILPASVSDDMLPFDRVRSQAPLAPTGNGKDAAKDTSGDKPKASEAAKTDPEPGPAATEAEEP